jgi:hypothetical protein
MCVQAQDLILQQVAAFMVSLTHTVNSSVHWHCCWYWHHALAVGIDFVMR